MKRIIGPRQVLPGIYLALLSAVASAQSSDWGDWLTSQIQQHPDVVAAREQWQGSNASADAVEQPIYNPVLISDLEHHGNQDNYRIGVQQTLDWWDKHDARQRQAEHLRSAALAWYQQLVLNKTAEALAALVEWQAANQTVAIAQAQQRQLGTLLDLVDKRQQAGDLGSIDAELTFLSLSQQLAQVAQVDASLQRAEARVRELLTDWTPKHGGIPEDFWPSIPDTRTDHELQTHPSVAGTYARWQSLKEDAEGIRRAAKADPTVGLNVGQDGDDTMVGLTFSIPLHVRNNFSAEARAAERMALEAKARFQATHRKQRFDWQAAYAAWQRFDQQYRRWQALVQDRIKKSADLLEKQWHSGDLSTTEYLQVLNQRAQSLRSGIELEKHTQLALTDVLHKSGQLMPATMSKTAPATTSMHE